MQTKNPLTKNLQTTHYSLELLQVIDVNHEGNNEKHRKC
jgi:hypothetical protein